MFETYKALMESYFNVKIDSMPREFMLMMLKGVKGMYMPKERIIRIDNNLPDLVRTEVLFHEIAHYIRFIDSTPEECMVYYKKNRSFEERIAEETAMSVMRYLGLSNAELEQNTEKFKECWRIKDEKIALMNKRVAIRFEIIKQALDNKK